MTQLIIKPSLPYFAGERSDHLATFSMILLLHVWERIIWCQKVFIFRRYSLVKLANLLHWNNILVDSKFWLVTPAMVVIADIMAKEIPKINQTSENLRLNLVALTIYFGLSKILIW